MSAWKERILPGIPIEHLSFSHNNKLIATSSKYNVTINTVDKTAPSLEVECSSPIVSITFNTLNELLTVTNDGELTSWEIDTNEVKQKNTRRVTAFPTKAVVWSHSKKHSVWITEGSDMSNCNTLSILMADQTLQKLDVVPNNLQFYQVAVTDYFVAYCNKKEIIKIHVNLDEEANSKEIFVYDSTLNGLTNEENEKNIFVRLAAHDNTIVASLSIGKIYVWNHTNTKKLTSSAAFSLHWHKVSAPMAITPFGGLISAGAETVLCKWSLKGVSSPTLLTRLQAAVISVVLSYDGTHAALLMEDNSLHVVLLSTMSILSSVSTVTFSQRCVQSVFMSDPRINGSVLLNGTPGWIQWLDLSTFSTMKQASISLENAVEGDMSDVRSMQTYSQLERFFINSVSAVSLESLVNFSEDTRRLRFWKRDSDYTVDLVDSVSVALDTDFISGFKTPSMDDNNVFIVCRSSGAIDLWHQNEEKTRWLKDVDRCLENWQNSSIVATTAITSEKNWASGHKNQTNFSVVVWSVFKMEILDVFTADGEISTIDWASDHDLIIATASSVTCWNKSSLSPKWIVEQPLKCYISSIGCFAWEQDHVIRFEPTTGALIHSVKFSSLINDLIVVNSKSETGITIIAKTTKGLAVVSTEELNDDGTAVKESETPFSRLATISAGKEDQLIPKVRVTAKKNVLKLLDSPCHSLPPLSHLAPLFIKSCLAPP